MPWLTAVSCGCWQSKSCCIPVTGWLSKTNHVDDHAHDDVLLSVFMDFEFVKSFVNKEYLDRSQSLYIDSSSYQS